MDQDRPDSTSRRIAVASALIIALIAAAFAVTIWRYQHSHGASNRALEVRAERLRADQAGTLFWRERESMNEYLLDGDPAILQEITAEKTDLDTITQGLGADVAAEAALVQNARAANDAFIATFDASRSAAGHGKAAEQVVVDRLNAHENDVLGPLESLQTIYGNEVTKRLAEARSASTQALVAALLGAVLALAAGIAFALYALRLLRQVSATVQQLEDRERALQETVADLSDRDELLERIKATAGVLGGVSNELRAVAGESAAATTEQSSA